MERKNTIILLLGIGFGIVLIASAWVALQIKSETEMVDFASNLLSVEPDEIITLRHSRLGYEDELFVRLDQLGEDRIAWLEGLGLRESSTRYLKEKAREQFRINGVSDDVLCDEGTRFFSGTLVLRDGWFLYGLVSDEVTYVYALQY